MMKKIITLVLCALMLLIFCSCGSAKTTTDSGKPEAEMAEAVIAESAETETTEAEIAESAEPETAEAEIAESAEPETAEAEIAESAEPETAEAEITETEEAESPETEITEAQDTAEAANVAGPRVGGWSNSADPAVTDEQRAVFDKALKGLLGVNYEPVAYLGSQIVAGTNHCFLCQAKAVVPDAVPYYVLIYIYEDLSGDAQIMNIADFDIGAFCEYGAAAKEN